jgi:hypothetical protein
MNSLSRLSARKGSILSSNLHPPPILPASPDLALQAMKKDISKVKGASHFYLLIFESF